MVFFISGVVFAKDTGLKGAIEQEEVATQSKSNSKFEKLGFKNGDIIKLNDGSKVGSTAKAMDLYNELKRSKVKVVEVSTENKGFKLSEVVKGSVYEKMGLRKGDIIRSYKGNPIVTADDASKMYSELVKNGNANDLKVERAIER